MKLLEERIRTHGKIREGGVLKVDSFLNHQMDVKLFQEMGKEFLRLFGDCGVTKILTIEASGIGIACVTAQFFDCPVIFAKKNKTRNIAGVSEEVAREALRLASHKLPIKTKIVARTEEAGE